MLEKKFEKRYFFAYFSFIQRRHNMKIDYIIYCSLFDQLNKENVFLEQFYPTMAKRVNYQSFQYVQSVFLRHCLAQKHSWVHMAMSLAHWNIYGRVAQLYMYTCIRIWEAYCNLWMFQALLSNLEPFRVWTQHPSPQWRIGKAGLYL